VVKVVCPTAHSLAKPFHTAKSFKVNLKMSRGKSEVLVRVAANIHGEGHV
jgi:hypothetical protein